MHSVFLRKVVGVAVGVLLLSACTGSGTGVPPGGVASKAVGFAGNGDAVTLNLSGHYKGTVSINHVSHKATLDVGQYRVAIGGTLKVGFGTVFLPDEAVWTFSGSTLAGTIVILAGGGCVTATTATYDPTTHVLSGKFNAVHGCPTSGTNGTYKLAHKCIWRPAGTEDVRPDAGGLKMC